MNYFKDDSNKNNNIIDNLKKNKIQLSCETNKRSYPIYPKNIPKTGIYSINSIKHLFIKNDFKINKLKLFIDEITNFPMFPIAEIFEEVSNKSGFNSQEAKRILLTFLFELVLEQRPEELVWLYYFCVLRTDVHWKQINNGIGEEILLKAVASATGRNTSSIRNEYKEKGCLGKILQDSKSQQNTLVSFIVKSNNVQENNNHLYSY